MTAADFCFLRSGKDYESSERKHWVVMIPDSMRIGRNPKVAAHDLGGDEGGVLLHLESGQYHGLNGVGWALWGLLGGPRSIAELVEELRRLFPEQESRLPADVRTFVGDLLERDLVEKLGEMER